MSGASRHTNSSVVVTGLGAVSAVGIGCDALWKAVEEGHDGIRPLVRFPTDDFSVHLGATVPDFEATPADQQLHIDYGVAAAREAWQQARVGDAGVSPERIALVAGMGIVHHGSDLHMLVEAIGDALSIRGPRITVSTACASSTNALGLGCDLLESGVADLVIAGGADVLTEEIFAGFHALGALSSEKCAPFSNPPGTTLGEGAGFAVLETRCNARERGVEPLCALLGYGLSADAYDATAPHPRGAGVARAITSALADAGMEPEAIGYVNAHGTGTAANDPAEWTALERVFGDHAKALPISASKSILGHAQGAAGVLEAIVTILAMRRQVLPQTLHFTGARPRSPDDPVGQRHPRSANYEYAVSTSSAFGGANATVVLGKSAPKSTEKRFRDIFITGAGAVAGHGDRLDLLHEALSRGQSFGRRVPGSTIDTLVPRASSRTLDSAGRYLTAAAALALTDAGLTLKGRLRDRAGLVVGVRSVSPSSSLELHQSIEQRGLHNLSARAFARLILNAPAGACARSLQIRGPHSTVSTGDSSGLVAIAYAAHLLATRDDADLIVAGGLHELDTLGATSDGGEGAACLLLTAPRRNGVDQRERVRLSGWGLAGPGRLAEAVGRALEMARVPGTAIRAVFGTDDCETLAEALGVVDTLNWVNPARAVGTAGAATPALATAIAVAALRTGSIERALVTSAAGDSATCALVLVAEPRFDISDRHTARGSARAPT